MTEHHIPLCAEIDRLRARVKELEDERDADRRREHGYSQQTVDALTADRDEWKRIALEGSPGERRSHEDISPSDHQ